MFPPKLKTRKLKEASQKADCVKSNAPDFQLADYGEKDNYDE
ncbi:hypothetical protein SAMN05444581_11818 [Methylocapsa palsarum]|uniref:Uncharacterized protein n=1 Tax=Methylocapsa palsarum TaxID=1612308 RepID=A0A1I4C4F8_9HYPH|nr:hypothetical protein SAMN05444581_11818 [Methylocapsa palsarum]